LLALGVPPVKTFTDQGLTGTNSPRPGLGEALGTCRDGDTLVVAKTDRLAKSLRDAKDIIDELTRREVKLSICGSVHDPTDPAGCSSMSGHGCRIRGRPHPARTREGMAVAKAKGKLRGKQPGLSQKQEAHLVSVHRAGHAHDGGTCRTLLGGPFNRLPCHQARRRVCRLGQLSIFLAQCNRLRGK
jgi:DNA invertase Pin-like site-specific DNA recombinase